MISLSNIDLRYGRNEILKGLNFSAKAGQSVGIMGPSGSGKSSLLSIMGCLSKPTSGSYQVDGQEITGLSGRELAEFRGKKIGFVFQSSHLLGHMNLMDNLLLAVEHLPGPLAAWHPRAEELLEQMGIADLRSRRPHQVSGGQAQRVAIARALMRNPSIILADEPTANLDQESQNAVLQILQQTAALGKVVLVVTHSIEVANQLSSTVRLQSGRLVVEQAEPTC